MQASGIPVRAASEFRVVRNVTKRGHEYSVMMDLSTDFMQPRGQPEQLHAVGAALAKKCHAALRAG